EVHIRHWFFAESHGFPESEWSHVECRPNGAEITADFSWTTFAAAFANLVAGHQDQLALAITLSSRWASR
ncbi:MAG: hypothetical protein LBQ06_04780, partial [Frankiaceae bacterium]|nr:hypothetical protein [Frankiaceae bacterium]